MYIIIVAAGLVLCGTVLCSANDKLPNELINVRTVLFTKRDLEEGSCWYKGEVGLLFNRYIMQDLLPRKISSNETHLNEYIDMCLQAINDAVTSDKAIYLLLHAMADVLGGYLQSYGLPMARRAYYEGTLDLKAVKNLYEKDRLLKETLNTNGKRWASPIKIKKPMSPIKPMKIHIDKTYDYCDDLILPPIKNRKKCIGDNQYESSNHDCPVIPLPFLDNCKHPEALAIPLRERCLFSLTETASQGILSRYYETSINCISRLARTKRDCQHCVVAFNKRFAKWMKKDLVSHLYDDEWYLALHGILKVYKAVTFSPVIKPNLPGCTDVDYNEEIGHLAPIAAFLLGLIWLVILLCILCRYCCTFKDCVNECTDECKDCRDRCCSDKPARLFTYNMACWTRPLENSSSTEWCKCSEPNYVDMERYETEVEESDHDIVPRDISTVKTVAGNFDLSEPVDE